MKSFVTTLFVFFSAISLFANNKDSVNSFSFPDTLKVNGFLAHVNVKQINSKKEMFAGIQTGDVKFSLETDKNIRTVVFEFPKSAKVLAKGIDIVASEKGELEWKFNWNLNQNYQLYIATATDSASNFTLYSGYIFMPNTNKWKLIGTCKIEGIWGYMKNASAFYSKNKKRRCC